MQIHNAAVTGSFTYNGIDISDITGSEQSVTSLNDFSSSILNYTSSNNQSISSLNAASASLFAATASLSGATASLFNYTSSNTMNIANLFATSASLNASVAQIQNATASIYGATSSLFTYTSSNNANIAALYTATASIYNATASIYGATSSLFNYSASSTLRINALDQYTASLNTRSASFACTTATNNFACTQYFSNTSNAVSFTSTGSLYSDGGVRITKDMYVSGTAFFNNVTVFGTQSVAYISSSQLNIGTNIISVNTDTPSVRFGGLAVYDSGSTGLTGSMLWDSEQNHWVYTNPSGSTYSGGMFISGPRASSLGTEQGTTSCMLLAGQGGDHLTSSAIYHSSTVTCIPNAIVGVNSINVSTVCTSNGLIGNNSNNLYLSSNSSAGEISFWGNQLNARLMTLTGCSNLGIGVFDPDIFGRGDQRNVGISVAGASDNMALQLNAGGSAGRGAQLYMGQGGTRHFTISSNATESTIGTTSNTPLRFVTCDSLERLRFTNTGIACFACQVCAPSSIIRGSINEQLILDFVIGAGSYTHQSFRLCGANQYRLIGNTNGNFILRNDVISSDVLTFACAGGATFANTVTAAGIITGTTGVNVGANALGADRMFQVSGTSFTTGTTQFGVVVNPSFCGTVTNVFGVYAGNNFSAGTITNSYNLYIEGTSAGSATITNRWGIYQAGGSDRNYFAGSVGICTTSPSTRLALNSYVGARLPYVNGTSNTFDSNGITVGNLNNGNTNIGGGIDFTNNCYCIGAYSPILSFSSVSSNYVYNNSYAGVWGVFQGAGGDANWNRGDLALGTSTAYGITEKMRIKDSGNVGIGATAPSSLLHICGAGTGAMLRLQNTSTVSGDQGPLIQFMSANQVGNQNFETGYIQSIWQAEGNAFGMRFATKGVDASQSEKMRITENGNVLIGKTSDTVSAETVKGIQMTQTARLLLTMDGSYSPFSRLSSDGDIITFHRGSPSKVGSISVTTSAVAYNTTSSDIKLKKNFENWNENVSSLFEDINPQKFNFTNQENGTEKIKGFIAQCMIHKFPEAYPLGDNGYYSFNPSGMTTYLMKAIQEQQCTINILKTCLGIA